MILPQFQIHFTFFIFVNVWIGQDGYHRDYTQSLASTPKEGRDPLASPEWSFTPVN